MVRIAPLDFAVREIATHAVPSLGDRLVVRALSPITVYRTLEIEGRRRTECYNPLNEVFAELVVANLLWRAQVLGLLAEQPVEVRSSHNVLPTQGQTVRDETGRVTNRHDERPVEERSEQPDRQLRVRIRAPMVSPKAKRLERYKGTWIEGWMGPFLLEGPPELLRLALEAGLGAKNSQGFGYVEEDPRKRTAVSITAASEGTKVSW